MGGSIGTPIFGAILTSRLADNLHAAFPAAAGQVDQLQNGITPAAARALPPAVFAVFADAYVDALQPVFLTGAAFAAVAFALAWFIQEVPLRQTVAAQGVADAVGSLRQATSMDELAAQAANLAGRTHRHLIYEALGDDAGVELEPPAMWLLFRAGEGAVPDGDGLAGARAELVREGLLTGEDGAAAVTPAGAAALERLREARQARVASLLADWAPERHPEILEIIARLTASLAERPPVPVPA
jgi:hypothetical protein